MPARFTRHGWLIAIAVAYLYVFPYFPRIHSANELPRVYLVQAIVDHHTFAIDAGVNRWGATADVSPARGHVYSNKAPGASLIVVPFYALVRLAGEPSLATTLWLCRIVAGIVPALLFLLLLAKFLARVVEDEAVCRLVLVAYALGSLAMTYAMLYYSHQLAAICIASAWILALDVAERRRGSLAMVAAGLLAGAAPLVDYQAAFAGVPVAVHVIVAMRAWPRRELVRALACAAAGAAVPIAMLLGYHAICFGSPWRTGYDLSQTFAHFHQQGFLGMTRPHAQAFWGSLFAADNGLFVLSPWLLLAIPGGVVLWRRERALVIVAAAVAAIFILFISSITFWRGGWGVGPRYVTAMLPFSLPLVAAALAAFRARPLLAGAACGTIVSSLVIYVTSAATFPYWPDSLKNPLYEITFRLLGDGAVAPNVAQTVGLAGLVAIAPFLLGIAVLAGWAIVRVATWRGLVAACVVGAAIVGALAFAPRSGPGAERAYVNTVYPAVSPPQ